MSTFFHKELAKGRWFEFSLAEQLANIGSEVSRAAKWQNKDKDIFYGAINRALELFDLTLADSRWKGRFLEIARTREIFCDAIFEGENYQISLKDLESYFLPFVFLAQQQKTI
jgi:hypothetical protein